MGEAIGKYLEAVEVPVFGKARTRIVQIRSWGKPDVLGNISWYRSWRQCTFNPQMGTAFNPTCLRDLADYLSRMTAEHKTQKREGGGE